MASPEIPLPIPPHAFAGEGEKVRRRTNWILQPAAQFSRMRPNYSAPNNLNSADVGGIGVVIPGAAIKSYLVCVPVIFSNAMCKNFNKDKQCYIVTYG
jgi:hypothetical protein